MSISREELIHAIVGYASNRGEKPYDSQAGQIPLSNGPLSCAKLKRGDSNRLALGVRIFWSLV